MKGLLNIALLFALSLGLTSAYSFAQTDPAIEDGLEDFIPKSNFPEPANREAATAVVNIDMDVMGLNPGDNELHMDEATEVKLNAYYNSRSRQYCIEAFTSDKRPVPLDIVRSDENTACYFVTVGPDWINVICSEQYDYSEDARANEEIMTTKQEAKQEEEVKKTNEAVLDKIKAFESEQKAGKKKKSKKKKKGLWP